MSPKMFPKPFPWQWLIKNRWVILSILLGLGWFVYCLSVNHRSSSTCRKACCNCKANELLCQRTPKEYFEDLPVCSAIIRGDMVNKKDEIARLLGSRKRLSNGFYLRMAKDCDAYVENRGFIAAPLSAEERDFPIAYSMVVHADVEMFERLLRAIYSPQNLYCVHMDLKSSEGFKEAVRAIVSCFPNVFIASKLESVIYTSWSRVQADLNCMEDLMESPVQWKYLLNTCGADLPIKTNAETVQALKLLNGKNSMESEPVPDHKMRRWQYSYKVTDTMGHQHGNTGIRKTPPPINPMFSGNAYFVVTRDFVKHVLEDPEIQHFMEWCKDTYSPDEHLWATLNRISSVPGSVPAHSNFHLSDMNAIARLVNWDGHAGDVMKGYAYPACTSTVRRSVCVYGAGDLQWMFQQRHLMANKFDPKVDDVAVRCVESVLRFKALQKTHGNVTQWENPFEWW